MGGGNSDAIAGRYGFEGRKNDRLKEKERERRKDPTRVDRYLQGKRRVPV